MFRQQTEIRAFEHSWESLPKELKCKFNKQEEQAYREGVSFFRRMASCIQDHPLNLLLGDIVDDHPMFVYIESGGDWESVWFAFTFYDNVISRPLIRLATDFCLDESAPKEVRQLYGLIGGIRSDEDMYDGLLPPESIRRMRSVAYENADSAGEVFGFLSYGNGDMLGWNSSGEGVLIQHDPSRVSKQDLDKALNDFWSTMTAKEDMLSHFEKALENRRNKP